MYFSSPPSSRDLKDAELRAAIAAEENDDVYYETAFDIEVGHHSDDLVLSEWNPELSLPSGGVLFINSFSVCLGFFSQYLTCLNFLQRRCLARHICCCRAGFLSSSQYIYVLVFTNSHSHVFLQHICTVLKCTSR